MQTRVCTACRQRKPLKDFRAAKETPMASDWCMECEERQSGRGASSPPSAGEEMIKLPPD